MWYRISIPLQLISQSHIEKNLIEYNNFTSSAVISVPRYIRIAERLISQIESGDLPAGTRLPPERELSRELHVNRMTLRRALQLLESQGFLDRKHGVGNFIAHSKIDRQMETVFRFTSGMAKRGYTPGTKLISSSVITAEPNLARDLGLPEPARVYNILRVRSINQEPILLESYKIPVVRFPDLEEFDLEERSIYEIFESEYGVNINRSRQSLEPVIAGEFEARLLQIDPGDPLMLERRISYDHSNQPIEYGVDRYRGDRFRFVAETSSISIEDQKPGV